MRKSGGILAIVGGSLGIVMALLTLVLATSEEWVINVEQEIFQGSTVSMLVSGFSGLAFSILVIVLGNAATKSQTSIPGMMIVLFSVLGGAIAGIGTALCLILSFVGGILALFPFRLRKTNIKPEQVRVVINM